MDTSASASPAYGNDIVSQKDPSLDPIIGQAYATQQHDLPTDPDHGHNIVSQNDSTPVPIIGEGCVTQQHGSMDVKQQHNLPQGHFHRQAHMTQQYDSPQDPIHGQTQQYDSSPGPIHGQAYVNQQYDSSDSLNANEFSSLLYDEEKSMTPTTKCIYYHDRVTDDTLV